MQDLIFILHCSKVSEFFVSREIMFHTFGPRHVRALKSQSTVLLILTESLFVSEAYIGYSFFQI